MRVSGLALVLTMSAGLWPLAAQAEQLAGSLEQALSGNAAVSSDVQLISHREYTAMEQRLRDMEVRMVSVETASCCEGLAGDCCGNGCDASCGNGCGVGCGSACGNGCGGYIDNWCCVCPGVTFLSEILFLRSYDSEPDSSQDATYETGSRYEIGYMNACGRSWRVRYFEFADPDFDGPDYLHLEYLDIEYAGRFTLGCNWRGELSGGLRWAQYDQQDSNLYDDTIGLVMGAQLRGPCFFGLESYGLFRQSYQYGHEKRAEGDFGTFGISEMQLGLEYQTCFLGGIGFARSFLEAQSWQGPEDDDSEDVGLFGFGFALGITR